MTKIFKILILLFHAKDIFLHPLKSSKNHWFSDVLSGYGNTSGMKLLSDVRRTANWIGLNILVDININTWQHLEKEKHWHEMV